MKKISPIAWAAIVVLAIVSLSLWTVRTRNSGQQNDGESISPTAAELRAESVSVDNTRRKPNRADPAGTMTATEMIVAQKAAQQHESQKVVEAGRNKLSAQYQSERVQGSWAVAMEQTLERLSTTPQIEELNAKPTSIDVNCRTSVCRITAEFPSKLAADDWFTLYSLNAGPQMPNVSYNQTFNPDGTAHVEIFGLARN